MPPAPWNEHDLTRVLQEFNWPLVGGQVGVYLQIPLQAVQDSTGEGHLSQREVLRMGASSEKVKRSFCTFIPEREVHLDAATTHEVV